MLDILQGTPLWVYAVYLWICYYGIKAYLGGRENRRGLGIYRRSVLRAGHHAAAGACRLAPR